MNLKLKLIFIILLINVGCNNSNEKKITRGEFVLFGNFIHDSIPDGTIKFYDKSGILNFGLPIVSR